MGTRIGRGFAALGLVGLVAGGGAWASSAGRVAATRSVARLSEPAVVPGSGAGQFIARTSPRPSAATLDASASVDCTTARLPNGWCLTPAGIQVTTLRFPLGITSTPDQSKVLVSSDSGGVQALTVIDSANLHAVPSPSSNLFMGVTVAANGTVYASGGNADRVFRYKLVGSAAVALDATNSAVFPVHHALDRVIGPSTLPAVDGVRVPGYPGLSVGDGRYVYVAGTLSEDGTGGVCPDNQSACARVAVIDTTTDTVVRRIPVGLDAYGLALDPVAHRLYVSNWADQAGRGAGVGTVSVVDVTTPSAAAEVATVRVGHHPSAVQLSADRRTLFVANTEDDTISVVRVGGPTIQVVGTQSVAPLAGVPVGAHPDAFALSPDGSTLFVALAGLNAVEMLDGATGAPLNGHALSIPTGWYPSALAITGTAAHYRLWVTNAKGVGPGPGANLSVFANGFETQGSVSVVDLPAASDQINRWTAQVVANDALRPDVDVCAPGPDIRRSEVLCPPPGQASPIKHVVYIVVENKTFDQYFGDLPSSSGYRADPTWLLYGQPVTPNQHALAGPYSLGDNFFSDAEVSVTGHSWTSGAAATDHNEKTWEADYDQGIRGSHGNGDPLKPSVGGAPGAAIDHAESVLNDPQGGYLFEAFARAGAVPPSAAGPGKVSMAIYGEHTAVASGSSLDAYKAGDGPWHTGNLQFFDTCRASLFLHGSAPASVLPDTTVGSPPAGLSTNGCGGATIPSQFTLDQWEKTLAATGADTMPSFSYLTLPVNHTLGTNVGSPTFASMVADNDYAIGLIVDALSHSSFWSSTAVMITQDDTQLSGDHISALRDELQVVSPWAQPGPDHQWGSMPALLRTIELLFGVRPISLYDTLAMPMHDAFKPALARGPSLAPYTVIKPLIPFAINQPGLPGSTLAADWSTVDRVDEQTLTALEYAAIRGWPLTITGPRTATVAMPR